MTITQFNKRKSQRQLSKRIFRARKATLFLSSIVILSAIIVAAWFAGEDKINAIFAEIK